MDPFLQDKLWDLFINLISFLVSGGLLLLLIEWRRHRREQRGWKREEERLEIDVPRAEMSHSVWAIGDKMSDKVKLRLYENQLLGKVNHYRILVDFVIRNTTNGELVVISYGVEETAPPGDKTYNLYDLASADFIEPKSLAATVLQPLGTIARTALVDRGINIRQKMDSPPTHVRIHAETSEGIRVQKEVELKEVPSTPNIGYSPEGVVHLLAYLEKFLPEEVREIDKELEIEEGEIPF